MTTFILTALLSLLFEDKPRIPPMSVQISENLYAHQTEVTNRDWAEYIRYSWLDTAKNPNDFTYFPKQEYPQKPDFLPKVNLSYEKALGYCKWITDITNKYGPKRNSGVRVNYRLPTESEIRKMLDYEEEEFRKRANQIAHKISDREDKEVFAGLVPTRDRVKGKLERFKKKRVYGLFHNAAEMSSVEGIAFGMTNDTFDPSGDLMPKVVYSGPSPNVGCRCVAEFIYEQD
ncbi:MAG: hypothetical protein Roseis2KO_00570 [Roseivirga sp.]